MYLKRSIGERLFNVLNYLILSGLCIATVYPFIFVLFASISSPQAISASNGILLWPKGLQFGTYQIVFQNQMISIGYFNTIFYVVAGTALHITLATLAAYGLSRKWLFGRNGIMFFIVFTIFFQGGLIPTYLIVRELGLLDTRWAMILPTAVSTFSIIIMRTFFLNTIPDDLEESAKMDGANDFTVLFRIFVPLSMPVISVILLFSAVGIWNSWFNALIYLKNRDLYPLQLVLKEILVANQMNDMMIDLQNIDKQSLAENIKYATIMISTLPILLVYPFLQKHFVNGIMIGSIKG